MKKILISLLTAALAAQCGSVCGFARTIVTVGEQTTLFSTDFLTENELASGWNVETNTQTNYAKNAAASIVTDPSNNQKDLTPPYLKISHDTIDAANPQGYYANQITVTKNFNIPENQTGIVRAAFKWSSDHAVANADLRLTDDNGNGIIIGSANKLSDTTISTEPYDVGGETQIPYTKTSSTEAPSTEAPASETPATGDPSEQPEESESDGYYCVYVRTVSGGSYLTTYALGEAYDNDLAQADKYPEDTVKVWSDVEIVANTSSVSVDTTIAGQNISLGSGVYAVAFAHEVYTAKSNMLKGYLPSGMGSFSKFTVMSKEFIQYGVETRLDDLSVSFQPVTAFDSNTELPIYDTFDETAGTIPMGWKSSLTGNSDTTYVSISNEEVIGNKAYLKIHKGDNATDAISADREFELPSGGALINISFDYLVTADLMGYGKQILLMNGDTSGVIVEHKPESGDSIVLTDKDGLGGKNYDPTVLGNEARTWRHFDFAVNCSGIERCGLAPGCYALSYNNQVITGKMRDGVTTLNKIRFTSAVVINSDTYIDNLRIFKLGFDNNDAYDVAMTKPETGSTMMVTKDEKTYYNVGYTATTEGAYSSVIIEKKYGMVMGCPLSVDLSGNSGAVEFGLQINDLNAEDEIYSVYISKRTVDLASKSATAPGTSSGN